MARSHRHRKRMFMSLHGVGADRSSRKHDAGPVGPATRELAVVLYDEVREIIDASLDRACRFETGPIDRRQNNMKIRSAEARLRASSICISSRQGGRRSPNVQARHVPRKSASVRFRPSPSTKAATGDHAGPVIGDRWSGGGRACRKRQTRQGRRRLTGRSQPATGARPAECPPQARPDQRGRHACMQCALGVDYVCFRHSMDARSLSQRGLIGPRRCG